MVSKFKTIMHFYKKILFIVLMILVAICFLTGLSNFDDSLGTPTFLEIKLSKNLRYSQYKSDNIGDLFKNTRGSNINDTTNHSFHTSGLGAEDFQWDEMRERVDRVKRLCMKYHLGNYSFPNGSNRLGLKDPITPLYSYFFHDRGHKLAWCPVYKSGSTTWLYNMMILKGYSESYLAHPPDQLSIIAEKIFEDAAPGKDFDNAYKLLVVRHPFQRLISAYKDKLSNSTIGFQHGTFYFYEKYGKKIVSKFRKNHTILQKEPTFEEFVRYLIKTDLVYYADDHWLPVYLSCTPCRVSYDFIAKVETYTADQKYVIEKMGLSGLLEPRWQHPSGPNHDKHKPSSLGRADQYFSQLTKSQVTELYKKYYLDFQLFGYSYEEYLELAKEE